MKFAVMLAAVLLLSGCESSGEMAAQFGTADSAGVRIVVLDVRSLEDAPRWKLSRLPTLRLGEGLGLDGTVFSRFYRISGVRDLGAGRTFVATDASKQYFVFDSTGKAVLASGGTGSGPGEFQHLRLVGSSDGETLPLFDAVGMRLTLRSLDPDTTRIVDLRGAAAGRISPVFRFGDQRMLAKLSGPPGTPQETGTSRTVDRLLIVDSALELDVDMGPYPADDMVDRQFAEGGGVWLPSPFGRKLVAAANDSTIAISSTGPFEIRIFTDSGVPARWLRVRIPRVPVTRAMRAAHRERLLATAVDQQSRRILSQLSADDVFPDSLPAFDEMLFDGQGLLWTRLSTSAHDIESFWMVLNPGGSLVAVAAVPRDLVLHDIGEGTVLGVWTDEFGREQVHRYELQRSMVH